MELFSLLKEKSKNLPASPGVYIMKASNSKVIYVGKAKSLRDRVSQYFRLNLDSFSKTSKMVLSIKDFSYIVTNSEFEALVLECNLIKKHSPKYNILLKDDKGYNYLKITNEYWPRLIFSKRSGGNDGETGEYLGPYTSSFSVKKSLNEARKIFKLPVCNKKFFDKNQAKGAARPCLYYHINQCMAPCCGKVSHEEYVDSVNEAASFLKGSHGDCVKKLTSKMNSASDDLDFERAAKIRDKIYALKQMKNRQSVVCVKIKNQDVIALFSSGGIVCFEVLKIRDGSLLDKETFFLEYQEELKFAREEFTERYYDLGRPVPVRITLDKPIDSPEVLSKWLSLKAGKRVSISVGKRGEQLNLVKLCQNNAKESLFEKIRGDSDLSFAQKLQKFLDLKVLPRYIESYDISNTAGEDNVGGLVVFKDGKPFKSAYKKFKIGCERECFDSFSRRRDDYASMCQMIERRLSEYEGGKKESSFKILPDLILLDGGSGHVSCVRRVLLRRGYDQIPVFGMTKDKKHKTSVLATDKGKLDIKKEREVFLFLSRIQEEVHRFTLQYHKSKRKNKLKSSLLSVPNIGKKRAKMLLLRFGSLKGVENASISELQKVPGVTRAVAENIKKIRGDFSGSNFSGNEKENIR
ncbi:MAG: excinuclease ABC subunit UvrC [Oscillospiraceae bacterium]|jgi:excinuclease ABC subunit C|nr:excinuclease ABC subunit UvrC [Oscillospiraceae bacterium]